MFTIWDFLRHGALDNSSLCCSLTYLHCRVQRPVLAQTCLHTAVASDLSTLQSRVSSKQTKIIFGLNRNKPKQDLFRVCFGLFCETKNKSFGLFRCFEPISKQPKQTELFLNKPKQTETTLNFLKNTQIYYLFGWVFCLFRNIETLCFGIEAKQPKHQNKLFQNKPKKPKKTKKKQ